MRVPPVKIWFSPEARKEALASIDQILIGGMLTLGEHTRDLEAAFATYLGAEHCVATSSGTSALEIALRCLGVAGKEVLVPTMTFVATPAAVLHAGGRVRFIDMDPETLAVSPEALAAAITPETAGVVVVHIGGFVTPRMGEIQTLCQERGLFLLEDAAHAHGSTLNGQKAGTFGDAAAFSFYPTKVMTTGEGGMIVTPRGELQEEARIYRDQGKAAFEKTFHVRLAHNWRMSEIHAALGKVQLAALDSFLADRRQIAAHYDEKLASIAGIEPFRAGAGAVGNYYKYITLLDPAIDRAALKARLRAEFDVICSGEVYDPPCHQQPIFAEHAECGAPHAEEFARRHMCLPIYATMQIEEADQVVHALEAALATG